MTHSGVMTGTTVLQAIDEATISLPGSVAVRGPDVSLTYGELSARADSLARRLRQLGVKPGDLVGLCLDRSVSLPAAALAIFRAGAAYVAIDPAYPDERVRWMLEDSDAAAVVTAPGVAGRLGAPGGRPVAVVFSGAQLEGDSVSERREPLPPAPRPTDLAYVVYTSGSTGRPKGAMVEHASLANLVHWHRATFALGPGDRCTQFASPGFDAAVWEIWPGLAAGAAIHVVPEGLRGDPVGLRDWLLAEGITVTFLPTAVAEGVMSLSWPEEGELRYLLTGGDVLTRRPPSGLGFAVVNNYGLSETAVVATSGTVTSDGEGLPSIGRPIAGVVAEIVDERLALVEPGVAGELLIGGTAVGRGYLNQADLTAERFLEDGQGRRYRTGDRVRQRADGELEFLGRLDDQLSIRGVRVEPGEVVAALHSHPSIEACVAVGVGRTGLDRRLVAYVVAAGDELAPDHELAEFLGNVLPEHALPSAYVWLDELPLTQHGKLDREALPAPAETTTDGSGGRRPESSIEAAIMSIVAELLDVEAVGMDQNFFLVGGHSMLGAQLVVRVEDRFGVEITLRHLFDHPTPAAIAAEVERQLAADRDESLVGPA